MLYTMAILHTKKKKYYIHKITLHRKQSKILITYEGLMTDPAATNGPKDRRSSKTYWMSLK